MDVTSIEIDVQLTFRECLRASYWYCLWKRKTFLIGLIASIIGTLLLFLDYVLIPDAKITDFWYALPVWAIIAYLAICPYWGAKRFVPSSKAVLAPHRHTFSHDGLRTSGATASSWLGWSNFYRVYETKHSFLLFTSRSGFLLIPKLCFASAEQMKSFKKLLQEFLPETARLR